MRRLLRQMADVCEHRLLRRNVFANVAYRYTVQDGIIQAAIHLDTNEQFVLVL